MELYADAFRQLASISAVLGGLSFTAAASLLAAGVGTSATDALRRPARITVATALTGAVALVVAALIWSLMAADIVREIAHGDQRDANALASMNWIPSIAFLLGTFLFFASVAASGWIASRGLGRLTTAVGGAGMIALLWMIKVFADFG